MLLAWPLCPLQVACHESVLKGKRCFGILLAAAPGQSFEPKVGLTALLSALCDSICADHGSTQEASSDDSK